MIVFQKAIKDSTGRAVVVQFYDDGRLIITDFLPVWIGGLTEHFKYKGEPARLFQRMAVENDWDTK